jgi:hypothetical protein
MTHVGKVSIEPVPGRETSAQVIHAMVDLGGSLVSVDIPADADPEIKGLVEELLTRIRALAAEAVNRSLKDSAADR